jgi:hypothetical protein
VFVCRMLYTFLVQLGSASVPATVNPNPNVLLYTLNDSHKYIRVRGKWLCPTFLNAYWFSLVQLGSAWFSLAQLRILIGSAEWFSLEDTLNRILG